MTYQKLTPNYGTADADDESSPLFLAVADEAGVANKKKNGVLTLAVVAVCFLFFTLGGIYKGSSNSDSDASGNQWCFVQPCESECVPWQGSRPDADCFMHVTVSGSHSVTHNTVGSGEVSVAIIPV